MIPLRSPGTRKVFYQDIITGQYYVNGSVVDEDTYLQWCSVAESANNDSDVSMTRTTGYLNSSGDAEYNPASIEETYMTLTGSSLVPERADTTWKELYRNYMKKLGLHKKDTALVSLAYLNDDDIPELLIKQTSNKLYYIIVTYSASSLNIAMVPYGSLRIVEKSNLFMLYEQPDDYSGHNAVVLEECAKMAARCEMINPKVQPAPQHLQDKHYFRKHGANAYYGQN